MSRQGYMITKECLDKVDRKRKVIRKVLVESTTFWLLGCSKIRSVAQHCLVVSYLQVWWLFNVFGTLDIELDDDKSDLGHIFRPGCAGLLPSPVYGVKNIINSIFANPTRSQPPPFLVIPCKSLVIEQLATVYLPLPCTSFGKIASSGCNQNSHNCFMENFEASTTCETYLERRGPKAPSEPDEGGSHANACYIIASAWFKPNQGNYPRSSQ
ncbi:hypothetical protein F5876DRAFT_69519 [Lentinula aff. lateritia]|uniref:Uncharacterized protein n=1 Tax=Lentinula aff. lateritia TaxID=2804960 RepID=A0ACC1TMD4_9AGAR|nr:hypothetical protein F5876DRAFT_69519 [Lentinula aff. lateritia]